MRFSRKHFWILRAALLVAVFAPGWAGAAIYDPDIPAALRTINCTNQSAFTTALAGAIPGDHIILADGTYTFGTLTKNGTSANPIVIEALNNAGAIINCTSLQRIYNSSYLILNGLKFTSSGGSEMFEVDDSRYIRITRCSFDGSGFAATIAVVDNTASSDTASHHNRYDHCRWYGKTTTGEYLKWSDSGSGQISKYDRIDHNFFDGRAQDTGNGSESTRMGVGTIAMDPSYMVCEYNLYKDCDGDAEVVSIKTSDATVRYNTFIGCWGAAVSLRQGSNNVVHDNIILAGGGVDNNGIKITGTDQNVHDNYIESCNNNSLGAIQIQSGDWDAVWYDGGYCVVDSLSLSNNVLYNNLSAGGGGIRIGGSSSSTNNGPYPMRNSTIEGNAVEQAVSTCYTFLTQDLDQSVANNGNSWSGNTYYGSAAPASLGATGLNLSAAGSGINYSYYRSLALTTNDVGPNAVDSTSNIAPRVSLAVPTNGASFTAPASITMTANASDMDGTVTNVGFYNGATLLGSDASSPYAYTWTNVAAGSYNLTARAWDNSNAVSTSTVAAVTVFAPIVSGTITNVYTMAGGTNWICPSGVTSVRVECWGGGGAGGSAQNPSGSTQCGGGGAGGAYAKYNSYPVTSGNVYYINVGAGGANSSTNNDTTVAGGDSWFNTNNSPSTIIIAKGGAGGESAVGTDSTTRYGIGGTGTTNGSAGNVVYKGGNGGTPSTANFGGSGGSSGGTGANGNSGSPTTGIGATAVAGGGNGGNANSVSNTSGPGQMPTNAPGGGGGGGRASGPTLQAGGTGSAGQVVLIYTINIEQSYTLTTSAELNGTISPASTNVLAGNSATFVITASNYYRIATLKTNGTDVVGVTFNNNSTATNFTWSNVQTSGVLAATFASQVTTNAPASVPYSWMAGYGLTNSGATFDQAAAADQDGDGLTAWQEYIAGTDPTNGTSCFKAVQTAPNKISWSPVSGRVYSVYWSTNLMKGFTALNTNILYPQGDYTNATPDSRLNHYQIKVSAPGL